MPTIYDAIAQSPDLRERYLRDWADAEAKYEASKQAAKTYTWEPGKGMVSHLDNLEGIQKEVFDPLREKWNPEIRIGTSGASDELAWIREARLGRGRDASPSEIIRLEKDLEDYQKIVDDYDAKVTRNSKGWWDRSGFGIANTITPQETAKAERSRAYVAHIKKLIGAPELPQPPTNPITTNAPSAWAPSTQLPSVSVSTNSLKPVFVNGRYVFQ